MKFLTICLCFAMAAVQAQDHHETNDENGTLDNRIRTVVAEMLERRTSVQDTRITELEAQVKSQDRRIKVLEIREKRHRATIQDLTEKINGLTNRKTFELVENGTPTSNHQESREDIHAAESEATEPEPALQKITLRTKSNSRRRSAMNICTRAVGAASHVAFSAYLSRSISHMAVGHTVKYDKVHLNDGNGYNTYTGVFTVPASGVYLFSFHWEGIYNKKTILELKKNGVQLAAGVSYPYRTGYDAMAGQTVVVRANAGEAVWVEDQVSTDGELYITSGAQFATFSGILIY